MLISNTLYERRRELGLTQVELSNLSGVSVPFIQLVESGRSNPSLETASALLSSLGLAFQIVEQVPDWSELSKFGVPIGEQPKQIEWLGTKSEASLRKAYLFVLKNKNLIREREAVEAYLVAIRDHYPTFFRRFKDLAPDLPKILSGRLIKLRRISLGYLGKII